MLLFIASPPSRWMRVQVRSDTGVRRIAWLNAERVEEERFTPGRLLRALATGRETARAARPAQARL
jgi:hypothetical protein